MDTPQPSSAPPPVTPAPPVNARESELAAVRAETARVRARVAEFEAELAANRREVAAKAVGRAIKRGAIPARALRLQELWRTKIEADAVLVELLDAIPASAALRHTAVPDPLIDGEESE